MHEQLFPASALYQWAFTHVSIEYPAFTARLLGSQAAPPGAAVRALVRRMAAIQRISGFEHVFDGWRYPDDLDYDSIFFAKALPPVFEDAVQITGHVFDEYLGYARQDGFALAVLSTYGLHQHPITSPSSGREMDGDGYHRRLAGLLAPRGIPLVDQYEYIVRNGHERARAHFKRDGHWSEEGHRWTAEALLELFAARPGLCPPRRS
jgi:hypothetical protein